MYTNELRAIFTEPGSIIENNHHTRYPRRLSSSQTLESPPAQHVVWSSTCPGPPTAVDKMMSVGIYRLYLI